MSAVALIDPRGTACLLLRELEDIVPEARFQMRFHLGR